MDHADQPRASQRVAAAATLLLFAVVGVVAASLAVLNFPSLLVAWVGLAVAVFGVVFELRSSGTERVVWLVIAGAGAVVMVGSLVWLGVSSPWGLLGVVIAIGAVGFLGSYALRERAPSVGPMNPTKPVLFVNPKSGGGKATDAGIADIASRRGIQVRVLERGEDLTELAATAIAEGADAVGMAGGDGSLGYVAAATIAAGVPFVCIPAGTRNHFARDLGLDRADIVGALDAFDGEIRTIDHATINGQVFLNVASLGLYAETVSDPGYRDAKLETARETLRSLEASGQSFDLRFTDQNGEQRETADLIMVSSGRYEVAGAPRDIGKRARLDSGRLGILSLTVSTAAEAVEVAALWAAGAMNSFPGWEQWDDTSFEVDSDTPVAVGLDGETLSVDAPLRFEVHPGEFLVAVPKGTPYGPSVSPLGKVGSGGRLWAIAMGKTPS